MAQRQEVFAGEPASADEPEDLAVGAGQVLRRDSGSRRGAGRGDEPAVEDGLALAGLGRAHHDRGSLLDPTLPRDVGEQLDRGRTGGRVHGRHGHEDGVAELHRRDGRHAGQTVGEVLMRRLDRLQQVDPVEQAGDVGVRQEQRHGVASQVVVSVVATIRPPWTTQRGAGGQAKRLTVAIDREDHEIRAVADGQTVPLRAGRRRPPQR